MSNTYYDFLRRDLIISLNRQLIALDVVSGDCLCYVGHAVRFADSSACEDWMVAYWLRRARQSIVFDGVGGDAADELVEQIDVLMTLFDEQLPVIATEPVA